MKKKASGMIKNILIFLVFAIVSYTVASIYFELEDATSNHARAPQQVTTMRQ